MNDFLEFDFGDSPAQDILAGLDLTNGICAVRLLEATDTISDDDMEDVFQQLQVQRAAIDLSNLPKLGSIGQAALRLREEAQLVEKGDLPGGLEPNDPLRVYLEEIAGIPAAGDVQLLAQELLDGRDSAQSMLVNLSLSRVVELAKEYVGHGVLLLDLIQEGSLGLWNGILEYTGGDFEQTRDWWIRQYMICAILRQARSSGLGQKLRQAVEDYRMTDERLLGDLGRNPTVEEMAQALHMTVEEVEAIRKTLENARMMGKAHADTEKQEESPEDDQAVEDTAYYQTREKVDDLMSGLTELETRLLNMRFGLDGKPPMTAHEAAAKLRITTQEAVELEAVALEKMRRSGV